MPDRHLHDCMQLPTPPRLVHKLAVCHRSAEQAEGLLRTAAQLLANLANGPATAQATWRACWPDTPLKLCISRAPSAHAATCQALLNWSRADAAAAAAVRPRCRGSPPPPHAPARPGPLSNSLFLHSGPLRDGSPASLFDHQRGRLQCHLSVSGLMHVPAHAPV